MFMVPTAILPLWFLGIWAFGLVGGGGYLLYQWYQRSWDYDPVREQYFFNPMIGWNTETAFLAGGVILLLWAVMGRFIIRALIRTFSRSVPTDRTRGTAFPEPRGVLERIRRPDGSEIQVECHGPEQGPPVVLSHGWGTNRAEWEYLRRDLADKGYRLIAWDLPGLGDSSEPAGKDYSLDNFARDLDIILRETCGNRPAVLAGHSIGGMTTLNFCKLFPDALRTRVAGLILVHTTYTNPVRTAKGAAIYTVLERPLLVPLLYLTIALSPILRLSSWMGYANGTNYLQSLISGFAGTQSWEELDFSTRFNLQASPAVIARGMLGMMRYDATEALRHIPVPTLVVPGDRDSSCRPEASEFIAREIPNARLVALSPANHMGLVEHHETFAAIVLDFLATCWGSSMNRNVSENRVLEYREAQPIS